MDVGKINKRLHKDDWVVADIVKIGRADNQGFVVGLESNPAEVADWHQTWLYRILLVGTRRAQIKFYRQLGSVTP
jgi:hypothetical protein